MNHEDRFNITMSMIADGFTNADICDVFKAEEPTEYNERVCNYQLDYLRKMYAGINMHNEWIKSTNECPTCQGKGRVKK